MSVRGRESSRGSALPGEIEGAAADHSVRASADRLVRNLSFVGIGVVGSAAVQYALFFLVARYLGVPAYGVFSLALTVALLATPFCNLGTSVALVHTCTRQPEALPGFLGAALVWRALLAVPVFVAALGISMLAGYPAEVIALLPALFVASLADGAGMLASSVYQTWERMEWTARIAMHRSLLRGAAMAAVLLAGGGVDTLAYAYAGAAVLAAALPWVGIVRQVRPAISAHAMATTLRSSMPFAVGVLAVLAMGQLDVLLLGLWRDVEEVGRYHAATRLLVLALLLPQVVTTAISPLAYKLGHHGPTAVARLYHLDATVVGTVGWAGALLLALHGDGLITLLLGSSYAGAGPLAVALAPVLFLRFVAAPLDNALRAVGRQQVWGRACCLAVLLNVGANAVLVPGGGALGAVLAMVATQLWYVLHLAGALRSAGVDLAWRRVFRRPLQLTALLAVVDLTGRLWPALDLGALELGVVLLAFAVLAWWHPTREETDLRRHLRRAEPASETR